MEEIIKYLETIASDMDNEMLAYSGEPFDPKEVGLQINFIRKTISFLAVLLKLIAIEAKKEMDGCTCKQ
jgi:hypothetical protein